MSDFSISLGLFKNSIVFARKKCLVPGTPQKQMLELKMLKIKNIFKALHSFFSKIADLQCELVDLLFLNSPKEIEK